MINPKEYPLVYLQTIQSVFTQIRNIVEKHSSLINIEKDHDFEIKIVDMDPASTFEFCISKPEYKQNKVLFLLNRIPYQTNNLEPHKGQMFAEQITRHLQTWIGLIRQYNNIQISPEDKILKAYEDEFFDNFKLVDEDANEKPYEVGKQLMLAEFLDSAIVALSNHDTVHEDLIIEAREIKEELPNLTKQATVKRLSRFFALVRKKGVEFLKSLIIAAKDEAIKQVVSGGFDLVKGIL
ncbi:hypothetical protein [Ancylomarina sp.]|uniref:hypothetical protein n=1 Tax=Ancylomarina sp. TaxID=1970196 RepID=UPI0035673545